MSKLSQLRPIDEVPPPKVTKGPNGICNVYGDGDLEDWAQVERLRQARTWEVARREVNDALGISGVPMNEFRYHWRRRCRHWTEEQKSVTLDDLA